MAVWPLSGPAFRPPCWILAIPCQCPIANLSTLDFGSWATKLGGTVRATKKHIDKKPGPGRNYGESAIDHDDHDDHDNHDNHTVQFDHLVQLVQHSTSGQI